MVRGKAPHRATRDIDLLVFGEPTSERLRRVVLDLISVESIEDGVRFEESSLDVLPIRKGRDYGGLRVLLKAKISSAIVRVQVDVGFGDVVSPSAVSMELPAILDFPAPVLRTYPRETVVAEKLEALVKLGMANSRMKDFYDLVALLREHEFDGKQLLQSIVATFGRRGTALPEAAPLALTEEFTRDSMKKMQWSAFLRKSGEEAMGELDLAADSIAEFVCEPLLAAREGGSAFAKRWLPGGSWE